MSEIENTGDIPEHFKDPDGEVVICGIRYDARYLTYVLLFSTYRRLDAERPIGDEALKDQLLRTAAQDGLSVSIEFLIRLDGVNREGYIALLKRIPDSVRSINPEGQDLPVQTIDWSPERLTRLLYSDVVPQRRVVLEENNRCVNV